MDEIDWGDLEREWLAGRFGQVFEELRDTYQSYWDGLGERRMAKWVARYEEMRSGPDPDIPADLPDGMLMHLAAGRVTTEAILAAVAVYVTQHELSTPSQDS